MQGGSPGTTHTSVKSCSTPLSFVLVLFDFVTPEGFTQMVANKGLEIVKAYLNLVPQD